MELVIVDDEQPSAPATSKSPSIVIEDEPTGANDIKAAVKISNIAPEVAAKNIERSARFNVNPDTYNNLKDQLEPDAIVAEKVPPKLEPVTEQTLRQSENTTAVFKDDIRAMNTFEKRATFWKERVIDIPDKRRKMNDLTDKIFQGESLTEGEEQYRKDLYDEMRESSRSAQEYGIGPTEEFGADIVSGAGDFIRSFYENKEIVGTMIGGGAVIGAAASLPIPIPGSTIVGLKLGAIKGAVGASAVVGFIDGYKQMSRGLYNELSYGTNDRNEPLKLSEDKKMGVSMGVGLVAGVLGGVSGKILASNNPLMKSFLSPASAVKSVVSSPALLAKMEVLGGIAKSAFSEGAEEAFQELVQIFGENFGKIDDSASSFENALDASIEAAGKTFTKENVKGAVYSGAVGFGVGGVITTVSAAPAYGKIKSEYEQVNYVNQRKQEVLLAQNNMIELAEDMKNMKVNELSPMEMNKFSKKVFSMMGVDEDVWLSLEDARKFANTPEKGEILRKIMGPDSDLTKLSSELEAPVAIPKSDFLQIMTQFPEISDFMRLTPDGENPLLVRNEAKEFAGRLDEAQSKRDELLAGLGEGQTELTPEQQSEILTAVKDSKYFNSREEYLGQAPIAPIEGVVTQKEVDELNKVHLEARLEIDKAVVEPVNKRFNRYAEAEFRTETENEIKRETEKLSKEYTVIDNFQRPAEPTEVDQEFIKEHKKKGFSAFAIDPKTLSESQKAMYQSDLSPSRKKNLKSRKAFVEGGIHVEEAAAMMGLENGEQLLQILSETPTKKQIETRIKNDPIRKLKLQREIDEANDNTRLVARDEAFTKLTNVHLKEAEFIASKEYPTLKRGIIKIAKKAPKSAELNARAQQIVKGTKIRDLNPEKWETGEKNTHLAAIKNYAEAQFEQAFDNKIKAAQNTEIRRETMKAQDKVEKYLNFWKRATSESNIQALKDAGMFDAMNEFMELYKLDGSIRGETEQNSFNNFIKKQAALGNFVPAIPDRLNNTQASYKDLTTEQYQTITEMGQFMLHQAKVKNKLMKSVEARNEIESIEAVQEQIAEVTQAHPDYDRNKIDKEELKTKDQQFLDKAHSTVKTGLSAFNSLESLISLLDEHNTDSYFYKTIGDPIAKATVAERTENAKTITRLKDIVNEFYGQEEFQKLLHERVVIPEFADFAKIGDGEGSIRKIDLMFMFSHLGDPDAKEALTNFVDRQGNNLTVESIQVVMDRELSDKDAAFSQNFFLNTLAGFKDSSFELHKKTTGIEPEMVEAVPIIHKGKVLPGGYMSLKYRMMPAELKAQKEMERLQNKVIGDEGKFFAVMRASEMTKQGRLKERTGSNRPVDLDYNNFFDFLKETVHDIHFREVGIDTLKILKNGENVNNIKAVIGDSNFGVLLDSVKDVVSNSSQQSSALFNEQQGFISRFIGKLASLHAINAIGFNVASAAIQADSLNYLALRAGPKAPIYLAKAIARVGSDLSHYQDHVEFASQILPDIKLEQEGIDNDINRSLDGLIPQGEVFLKNYPKTGNALSKLKRFREKAVENSFIMVREADKANKVFAVHALTEQFMNGDFPGFDMDKINSMSPAEKVSTLRRVVKQTVDNVLTAGATKDKTYLEKMALSKLLVNYWTDRRSRLNNIRATVDKTRWAVKRGENMKAANHLLLLSFVSGSAAAFQKLIKDDEESILNRLKEVNSAKRLGQFAIDTGYDFLTAPVVQTLESIPLVDSAKYSYDMFVDGKSKTVRPTVTPVFGVISDTVLGAIAMRDWLEAGLDTDDISERDRKALLTNAGYLMGGAPMNSVNKLITLLNEGKLRKGFKFVGDEIRDTHNTIDKYIEKYKDDKDYEPVINDLKEYKKTLPQLDVDQKNMIPEDTKEVVKEKLSGGKWNKYNPETGAAGIYQFTEEQWERVSTINPELGLTENGRIAKDPKQQEKAMDWVIQDATRGLLTSDIPVTTGNILGVHQFGLETFQAIHNAKDSQKLSEVIGERAKEPIFKDFKTIKNIKEYLSKGVKNAK